MDPSKEYKEKLSKLLDKGAITDKEFSHFVSRGIQYFTFGGNDYPELKSLLPNGIPIGASNDFINQLDIPYQETSYVAACCNPSDSKMRYVYKTNGKGGGVVNLIAGERPLGDNIFASLNRILVGRQADIISADNLVENREQIWNWHFFGDHLKQNHPKVYSELEKMAKKYSHRKNPILVVLARKKSTFDRLKIIELYKKNQIACLLPENETLVVFLTNSQGLDHATKNIPEEKGHVCYISHENKKGEIDILSCLRELRKQFDTKILLNDGGRAMSDGMKSRGILGGERITYEPYPGEKFMPDYVCKSSDYMLGEMGAGLDGSELKDAIELFSTPIRSNNKNEVFKIHAYPMQYSYFQ